MSGVVNFEYGPKKAAINIKPNDTIAEALSLFCKKYSLTEGSWDVLNGRKEVDLSLPFRLSGLTNNAKLILVKKSNEKTQQIQEVNIALQMSSGRLVAKFQTSTTLWNILKYWEKEKGLNLTREGDIAPNSNDKIKVYMQPVIVYTTKEIGTNKDLRYTTLLKLGITTGNSVLRLLHKYTTIPLDQFLQLDEQSTAEEQVSEEALLKELESQAQKEQAESALRARLERERNEASRKAAEEEQRRMAERVKQYIKEEEEQKSKIEVIHQQQLSEQREREERERIETQQERLEAFKIAQQQQIYQQQQKELLLKSTKPVEVEIIIPERNIEVFSASSVPFDPRSIDIPNDFYDFTSEDLQLNALIQKERRLEQEKQNSTLRTKEMRDRDKAKKLSKFKKCFVRVRFPDRVEIQATFSPLEKPSSLYQIVKDTLSEDNQKAEFYLYVSPPKTIISHEGNTNFRDLGYLPAVLVHLGIKEGSQMNSPFLRTELLNKITEKLLPPPQIFVPKTDQPIIATNIEHIETNTTTTTTTTTTNTTTESGNAKSQPSWFTKGKKN